MIPIYRGEDVKRWLNVRRSSAHDDSANAQLQKTVKEIIRAVVSGGDSALAELAARFGDPAPQRLIADEDVIAAAIDNLAPGSKTTIDFAAERIKRFANATASAIRPVCLRFPEYQAGLDFKPVRRAACYVPGGRYPLPSTALMTALSAQAAGVSEIAIFSPALSADILYAGSLAGVKEYYQIGGAQAVAAACYGTDTVERFDMIVGPGNAYVTEAKRQLQGEIGIDMLAGPSEIAIIADKHSNANWICLDLLSQAEHDPDARAYLISESETLIAAVAELIPRTIEALKLPDFVQQSLAASAIILLEREEECFELANSLAPEHLLLHLSDPQKAKLALHNYGALFMGYNATVPYGDYTAGPNHTLPTGGSARFCSGLTPLTFLRTQSWINVPACARELSDKTAAFAKMEGLVAHAAAATVRVTQADSRTNI